MSMRVEVNVSITINVLGLKHNLHPSTPASESCYIDRAFTFNLALQSTFHHRDDVPDVQVDTLSISFEAASLMNPVNSMDTIGFRSGTSNRLRYA